MAQLNNQSTPYSVKELNALENTIKKYNKYADGINENLVKAVEIYQKKYIKYLRELPVNSVSQLGSINPMQRLGFGDLAIEHIETYNDNFAKRLQAIKNLGVGANIGTVDFTSTLNAIKRANFEVFAKEAESLDAMVKARLVNSYVLGEDYQKTVSNLSDDLLGFSEKSGKLAKHASTYMNSAFVTVGRIADQEVYSQIGGDEPESEYIYAGPVDNITSDICFEHVGKIRTRSDWEAIGDQEGMDVFAQGLHWNCRHVLILVR